MVLPFRSNIDRSFPRIATISDGKLEAQKKKKKKRDSSKARNRVGYD